MCCVDIPGVCFGDGFCFDTAFAALVSLLLSCAKLTQGDVLLFFFTKKKKRSKKRKAFRLPLFCKATYYTIGSVTPQSSLRLASSSVEEPNKKSPLIEEMPDRAEELFSLP